MVAWCLTNAYQSSDLGAGLPSETFTNLDLRDGGLHIDVSVVAGIGHQGTGWPGWHRVIRVDNVAHGVEPLRTLDVGWNGGGRCHKEKSFSIRPAGMLF